MTITTAVAPPRTYPSLRAAWIPLAALCLAFFVEMVDNTLLSVALPKGRLGEQAYSLMERAGYGCPALLEDNRKLTFENEQAGVRYLLISSRAQRQTTTILRNKYCQRRNKNHCQTIMTINQ